MILVLVEVDEALDQKFIIINVHQVPSNPSTLFKVCCNVAMKPGVNFHECSIIFLWHNCEACGRAQQWQRSIALWGPWQWVQRKRAEPDITFAGLTKLSSSTQ